MKNQFNEEEAPHRVNIESKINDLEKEAERKSKLYSILFGIAIVIVIILPILFTKCSSAIGFNTDTAAIGDTFSGTMGPFIAIIAAWLTFKAFWTQYQANIELQKNNIYQQKEIALDHFENKFYEMLRIHRENIEEIAAGKITGRKAFIELYYEISISYAITLSIISILQKENPQINQYIKNIKDKDLFQSYILEISYGYFFYGMNYLFAKEDDTTNYLINSEITKKINLLNTHFQTTDTIRHEYSIQYSKFSESSLWETIKEIIKNPNKSTLSYRGYYPLFGGYNSTLGHYYRHLFQTVKFVASQETNLISEKKKYDYTKMIRGQLSDYEQIVLFYNSTSKMGKDWNKCSKDLKGIAENENLSKGDLRAFIPQMAYIPRFKLIKNIPSLKIYMGVVPSRKYENEIKIYYRLDEDFFEHREKTPQ